MVFSGSRTSSRKIAVASKPEKQVTPNRMASPTDPEKIEPVVNEVAGWPSGPPLTRMTASQIATMISSPHISAVRIFADKSILK